MSQIDVVANLLPPNQSRRRMNCVFCGGRNTLSISRIGGLLLWHCHRASCDTNGREKGARTLEDMQFELGKLQRGTPEFVMPDHFTNVLGNEEAIEYLRRNNCLVAYSNRLADIRYDPRQNRVVFVCKDEDKIIGATGRALDRETQPKWYRYDTNQPMFVAGNKNIAVIVEDAASACAVAPIATGMALMGTNLAQSNLSILSRFDEVIVALDPDAQRKAIDMERIIQYYAPTRTVLIENDLKYFPTDKISTMLRI